MVLRPSRDFLRALLLRDCYWVARHFANTSHNQGLLTCRRFTARGRRVRGSELSVVKACESRATDQSILNAAVHSDFDGRRGIKPGTAAFLPGRYNAGWASSAARGEDTALIHFSGSLKPWDEAPRKFGTGADWKREVRGAWRRSCSGQQGRKPHGVGETPG